MTYTINSKSDAFKAAWAYARNLLDGCKKYGWTLRKLFNRHIGGFMKKYYKNVSGKQAIEDKKAAAFYNKTTSFGNFKNDYH